MSLAPSQPTATTNERTMKGVRYAFMAGPWQHAPPGGWWFVALPADLSAEIRQSFGTEEEGWGRLKATARIGGSEWRTAIWYDTKHQAYLLPLKAAIRKAEGIMVGKGVRVEVWV